jgi:hypothetical protein
MSSIVATRMQDVQFLTSAKGINLMIMCGMCNTFDHHGEYLLQPMLHDVENISLKHFGNLFFQLGIVFGGYSNS